MKIMGLLTLVVCFAIASTIVQTMHLTTSAPYNYGSSIITDLNETVEDSSYLGTSVGSSTTTLGLGDFISGLFVFTKIFFKCLFLPSSIFAGFGVPTDLAVFFGIPIYLLYIVAIIQFLSGRYIE